MDTNMNESRIHCAKSWQQIMVFDPNLAATCFNTLILFKHKHTQSFIASMTVIAE